MSPRSAAPPALPAVPLSPAHAQLAEMTGDEPITINIPMSAGWK
jgi:hypothetical protein